MYEIVSRNVYHLTLFLLSSPGFL